MKNDLEKPGVGPFWESGDPVKYRPLRAYYTNRDQKEARNYQYVVRRR